MQIVSAAVTSSGHGIWTVTGDGTVVALGDAYFHGAPDDELSSPVVAILATPSGRGYHLVTETGEVHSFGDARPPAEPAPALTSS